MKRMLSRKIVTSVLVLACLSIVWFVSGCAAKAGRMVPKSFEVINKHDVTVSVKESTGGIDAKPLWNSEISNSAFTEALSNALVKSGVFKTVIRGGGVDHLGAGDGDYVLDVNILEYDHPWHGANFDIRMNTKWTLTDAKTHTVVWSNTFKTNHREAWLSSLFDGERIEKAHEASVRTNIKEGIRRISILGPPIIVKK